MCPNTAFLPHWTQKLSRNNAYQVISLESLFFLKFLFRSIHQAIANLCWVHQFKLIFTEDIKGTAKILEYMGKEIEKYPEYKTRNDIDIKELNEISNRRARVTKVLN